MKLFKLLFFLAYVAAVCLFTGCQTRGTMCSESEAVDIAKREFERRGGAENVEAQASYLDDRWSVTIWRLPKSPGGFVTVEVSNTGQILDYLPGL